jgi:hypothetical protein
MVDRVEIRNLFEELVSTISKLSVWKVGDGGLASAQQSGVAFNTTLCATYGQEIIETSSMPTIIALLTLYAIRYAVINPPPMMPSHIYNQVSMSSDSDVKMVSIL